jgi:hypothetical protein
MAMNDMVGDINRLVVFRLKFHKHGTLAILKINIIDHETLASAQDKQQISINFSFRNGLECWRPISSWMAASTATPVRITVSACYV